MADEPTKAKLSWLDYGRLLFKGKAVLEVAIAEGKIVADAKKKSSWKSTEFWMALLGGIGAVAAQAGGVVPAPYGAVVMAVSGAFYAVSRGMVKKDDALGGAKPGVSTTEFWLSMLTQIGTVAAAAAGACSPEVAAILVMVSNGAFGLSRGLAKGGVQPPVVG